MTVEAKPCIGIRGAVREPCLLLDVNHERSFFLWPADLPKECVHTLSTISVRHSDRRLRDLYGLRFRRSPLTVLLQLMSTSLLADRIVVITGASGSLGCMLLAQLATDPSVRKVICLNRGGPEARQRQMDALKERGVSLTDETWKRINVFGCDASKPYFGLQAELYDEVPFPRLRMITS